MGVERTEIISLILGAGRKFAELKNSKFRTAPGRDLWERSVQKSPPWVLGAGRRFAEL